MYIAGETESEDYPVTAGAYDLTPDGNTGYSEGFLAKFDADLRGPVVTVTPNRTNYGFGLVVQGASSFPQSFMLSVSGEASAQISSVGISGADASHFTIQNDTCTGQTVSVGGNCTFEAVFAPTTEGLKNANIDITSTDTNNPVQQIALTGNGEVQIVARKSGRGSGNFLLTAVPDSGMAFTGWSGICSGTGPCYVDTSSAQEVTATFNQAVNTPPTFDFIEPDGNGDVGQNQFSLTWNDADPDDNASIDLYYDDNGFGADGTLIAADLTEDEVSNSYDWDTSVLSPGTYFVYATVNDSVNPTVISYAAKTVTITDEIVPVAVNDSYELEEDSTFSILTPGVRENDTNASGENISVVLDTDVSHGTLTLNSDGSFSYVPSEHYNGADRFMYHLTDGSTDSSIATVNITVTAVNDAPSITLFEPDGTDDQAHLSFDITWADQDVDDDALISLYYDIDNTGFDGTLMVENISEDDTADSYTWDTSTIAPGNYYVYATINDGTNPPVSIYSLHSIEIEEEVVVTRCVPPLSGDWVLTESCALEENASAPADVIIHPNTVLTIPSDRTLFIDLLSHKLLIKKEGGVLIKQGGTVKQTPAP